MSCDATPEQFVEQLKKVQAMLDQGPPPFHQHQLLP